MTQRRKQLLSAIGLAGIVSLFFTGCSSAPAVSSEAETPAATGGVDAELAALVPDEFKDRELVLAGPGSSAPSIYQDEDGEWKGWEVELAKQTAELLGLDITFQDAAFDTIIPGLQSGKFDLAASTISINDERLKTVDFVQTSVFGQAFAAAKGHEGRYESVEDLAGLRVATVKGNTAALKVEKANEELTAAGKTTIESVEFPSTTDAQQALLSDRADIFFIGELPIRYFVSQHPADLEVVGTIGETAFDTPGGHGTAFPKDSALVEAWAAATQQLIDDGTVATLTAEAGVGGVESSLALVNPTDSVYDPASPDNKLAELGITVK
ncbi:MAG: transporter substrate-binding domain-containing protein [Pseudoclavibacter sp.]